MITEARSQSSKAVTALFTPQIQCLIFLLFFKALVTTPTREARCKPLSNIPTKPAGNGPREKYLALTPVLGEGLKKNKSSVRFEGAT